MTTAQPLDTRQQAPAALSADQLRELRAALHEQRSFRSEQLAELAHAAPAGDAVDEIAARLRAGARFALAQIEAALERMDTGRYGLCVRCAARIPFERLEILPMAGLCVHCRRNHDEQGGP
jgi:RNA polymerase-binding transcription factor DksA